MTALVPIQQQSSMEILPIAWELAERIARTDFVPTALRGKPEAVLAAILTGHELGIGAMQSLSKIHVIEGRPAMAAELMRALVLGAGHELWVEESTTSRCIVVARRSNGDRESRFAWTLDDAKRAGLDRRQNWQKYPRAMLLARASSEAVRAVFPDVVAGVSYSVEELSDGDVYDPEDLEASNGTRAVAASAAMPRRARARKSATAGAAASKPLAAVPAPADVPPLPGEDETIEISGTTAGTAGPDRDGEGSVGSASADPSPSPDDDAAAKQRAQQVAMWCNDAGLDDDGRHAFLAAYSFGQYSSAKDVPVDDLADLRAATIRFRRGETRIEGDRLTEVMTGLPSSDPSGTHRTGLAAEHAEPIEPELLPDYASMKAGELAAECRRRGITPEGNKAELIALLEGKA
jgi:hypothetical protein